MRDSHVFPLCMFRPPKSQSPKFKLIINGTLIYLGLAKSCPSGIQRFLNEGALIKEVKVMAGVQTMKTSISFSCVFEFIIWSEIYMGEPSTCIFEPTNTSPFSSRIYSFPYQITRNFLSPCKGWIFLFTSLMDNINYILFLTDTVFPVNTE
eukprot:TRINITY_DN13909_c1_g1_i1.p1 TRINITY_DN13909_c1_g1~~TRINITY_DN13909_c1_g1_i1.p1  ORF type:complete len:151 (+),score=8.83 TRINITY_DN13909_c1_g1_i1:111-563(+)